MSSNSSSSGQSFFERHRVKITGALLVGGCYALVRARYTSMFRGSVLKADPILKGKTVVITEPHFAKKYSGYYAAKEFASRGANVYVLVPKEIRGNQETVETLRKETGNQEVHLQHVDLASLRSIRRLANSFRTKSQPVDFLIHNADLLKPPSVPSEEGFPRRFVVNYLGRAILTQYLLESLNMSSNGKVLNVNTSIPKESGIVSEAAKLRSDLSYHLGHPEVFNSLYELDTYTQQLYNANRKFVVEMAKRLKDTKTTVNQVEVEMKRAELMTLRLSSYIFQDLVFFYRHSHASAGKLIAYAALSDEYTAQSGVVINGRPPAEQFKSEDSEIFFRHTSEILEQFEDTYPLRPVLEAEKYLEKSSA